MTAFCRNVSALSVASNKSAVPIPSALLVPRHPRRLRLRRGVGAGTRRSVKARSAAALRARLSIGPAATTSAVPPSSLRAATLQDVWEAAASAGVGSIEV